MFRVAKLLLAKLGDFVLPSLNPGSEEDQEEDMDEYDYSEIADKDGDRMCLYVHKRDDQPAHEVVQKFLRYSLKIKCQKKSRILIENVLMQRNILNFNNGLGRVTN